MKLISLSMIGYRQFFDKIEVQFPQGMTGICGPNGVGKSKLIEAIGFALYGPRTQILPAGDKREYISSQAANPPVTEVTLTIEVRSERYVITRTLSKAEIRVAGAADVLATTPKGVTLFVTRLLRLPAEAFVGTFVARQNEVAKLHTLEKKPRIDLIHRLIGISQLQAAIELADKEVEERKQELRRAEGAISVNSSAIKAEMGDFETAMKLVIDDEQKVRLELAACTAELQQKRAMLEEVTRRQEQKTFKQRELDLQKASHRQTLTQQTKIHSDWQRAHDAFLRKTTIEAELVALIDAEAVFQHWEVMSARETLLKQRQALHDQLARELKPAYDNLLGIQDQQQALDKEIEPIIEDISTCKTKKTVAAHCKSQAERMLSSFQAKRTRMVEIGPGGLCENCGMTLEDSSYQVALDSCDQSILQYQQERDGYAQEESGWRNHLSLLDQKHRDLQTRKKSLQTHLTSLAAVPGQVAAAEHQITKCDEQISSLGTDGAAEPFSQSAYDDSKEKLERKNKLVSELSVVSVSSVEEERYRKELDENQRWLEQLISKIQVLENEIQQLAASEPVDQFAEEAFQTIEAKHQQLADRGRDALQFRTRAETQLEERYQNLERIRLQEANADLLRQKLLTCERTHDLFRQMLNEINDEARPRLAELMDTWLRSLIGEKFHGVTLSDDYRVHADCGAGFRLLDHFSGGEQTLLSVMLRVAISLFCQERAGFDTSFLILDEVFGNQDEMHRRHLVNFLTEIQDRYHQILVVNHIEDVTQMLDTIIEVVPVTLNTSCIKQRPAIN